MRRAKLEAELVIPHDEAMWWVDDEGEWVNCSYEQIAEQFEAEQLINARRYFVKKYGNWFVEMGFARVTREIEPLVVGVYYNSSVSEQVLMLEFWSARMGAAFKLAFNHHLV